MSSPIVSRWSRGTRRPARRAEGPSLREVCLVGDAGQPATAPEQSGQVIRRSGRSYRVADAQRPSAPDPRRYIHLVAVAPDPAGV